MKTSGLGCFYEGFSVFCDLKKIYAIFFFYNFETMFTMRCSTINMQEAKRSAGQFLLCSVEKTWKFHSFWFLKKILVENFFSTFCSRFGIRCSSINNRKLRDPSCSFGCRPFFFTLLGSWKNICLNFFFWHNFLSSVSDALQYISWKLSDPASSFGCTV